MEPGLKLPWVSVAVSIASTAYALFFAPKPELGGFHQVIRITGSEPGKSEYSEAWRSR
jgi:hypothetical protein